MQPCPVHPWRHLVGSLHCNKPASDCRYPAVYVFKHDNLRNDKFKELREELKDTSRSASLKAIPCVVTAAVLAWKTREAAPMLRQITGLTNSNV